jgi:hypothetical protein
MCRCTPEIRTPFCGRPGCVAPPRRITRADVLAALEHENFCRWPDHRDCCNVTVEDCTCNVTDNLRTLERLGWLQVSE